MRWSLEEFRVWALQQGQVAKFDDDKYLGECVSLINQYCYRVLDVPAKAWGHAKDWATNVTVLSYFDKVSSVQAGDILIYPATGNNPYGHIEIALGGGLAIGQNRLYDYRIRQLGMLGGYIAILRKKGTPEGGDDMRKMSQEELIWNYRLIAGVDPSPAELANYAKSDRDYATVNEEMKQYFANHGQGYNEYKVRVEKEIQDLKAQLAEAKRQTASSTPSEADKKLQAIKVALKDALDIK